MKFKELEVYGFKSFADKLKVTFGGGITGIVGPNGCGKSNVADAVRWVLGEQSAKLLRGKNMMDVIFNGTEKRKSLSYCEVALHFDNSEKLFPSLDYNEVVVCRKLYRSGESQYFINGQSCRLKDITELLREGGMGREGYSIIGQGRIDELLSAKPEDRRAIFEEAAGISKYKAKKIESERKLARARENLVRIDDIMGEKSRQLEPLTIQAEKARKYIDLKEKLKENEINIYLHQRDTAEQVKAELAAALASLSEQLAEKEKAFAALIEENRITRDKFESLDADMDILREELTALTVGIEKQTGEININRQSLEYVNAEIAKLEEEIGRFKAEREQYLAMAASEEEKSLTAQKTLAEKTALYETKNAEYETAAGKLSESMGKVEEDRRSELNAMERLAEIKSNMSRLNAERELLKAKLEAQGAQLKDALAKKANGETLIAALKAEIDGLSENKDKYTDLRDKLGERHNELIFTLSETDDKLAEAKNRLAALSARHKLIKDMKDSYEGFAYGVRNLLQDAKKDKALSARIEGVVAELISVPSKYETAIEIALGGAYQNVVTETESEAEYLIDYLDRHRRGRVTFLPISAAKPLKVSAYVLPYLKEEGCYGVASDLIGYDGKYREVILGLLGNTVVVESKAHGIKLAKKTGYGVKIVTLKGEVFSTRGSITGGSMNAERSVANIFTHERELKELGEKLKAAESDVKTLSEKQSALAAEKESNDISLKDASAKLHEFEINLATKSESYNAIKSETDTATANSESIKSEYEKDSARVAEIEKDLNSVGELEGFLAGQRREASESGQEQTQFLNELRGECDRLKDECSSLKLEIAAAENEMRRAESDRTRFADEAEKIALKAEENSVTLALDRTKAAQLDELILELSKKSQESDTEKVKEIRLKIASMDDYKRELNARLAQIEEERGEFTENVQKLRERKMEQEFRLQNVDADIEQKAERLLEDYELTYEQCLPYKLEEYDLNRGVAEAAKLKRSIANLGDVNLGAIEQCKTAYEEYRVYSEQRDDLAKAEADLVKIIKDLSADMLKQFNENFAKIRTNFIKIFKELFDGGNADLYIVEDEECDDPLEAGIEIVAQPPQKKLQSISLLSGGERALTAIAILFAILKLKPMPFCILDEIEAALDDANAGRFAKYLRRFSEETQFIVITHRKPTMELADSLYGVTMEEKGVSKIVSVKLSDAVANSAEATGA